MTKVTLRLIPILQCTSTFCPSARFSSIKSQVEPKRESRSSAGLSSLLSREFTIPNCRCSRSVEAGRSELMIVRMKVMLAERRESMLAAARKLGTYKALSSLGAH